MPKDYDKIHRQNIERYSRQIRQYYLNVINEVSKLSVGLSLNANNEFYFRNYSELNKAVNELILELNNNVRGAIIEGVNTEWDLANEKNDEITRTLFGKKLADIPANIRSKYLSNNYEAKQAFLRRKIDGLGLSDRVWNLSRQYKEELELALEYSIGQGKSATETARQIKRYLNDPDKLFRRVKDKNGVLRLSKNAKAYNPGRGFYRSSYRNALRVSRNENNFAYRAANYEKVQKADYIVAIRVNTVPGWTPKVDLGGVDCSKLSGLYPADYNFRGNHINCRCFTTNVLKSESELDDDLQNMVSGKEPSRKEDSTNYIGDYQPFFKRYVEQNKDKFDKWANTPLFLTDYK